ncbi:MAG: hypothetical protein H6709_07085 [Kofleriaceae bacterium]|nr:hypothetical protein [Myxococcales bacterium]MCB9560105.1 hypothetical protein [Kofleriaceae bacterium]MCB9571842.1 hypothetical protein [Kofleriaceae bacterium]
MRLLAGTVASGALVVVGLLIAACGDNAAPADAGPDAAPDAPAAAACAGDPSTGCEVVVATASDCPSYDEVCAGVCGAAYDCCYCGTDGAWTTAFIDCAPCPDAGVAGP